MSKSKKVIGWLFQLSFFVSVISGVILTPSCTPAPSPTEHQNPITVNAVPATDGKFGVLATSPCLSGTRASVSGLCLTKDDPADLSKDFLPKEAFTWNVTIYNDSAKSVTIAAMKRRAKTAVLNGPDQPLTNVKLAPKASKVVTLALTAPSSTGTYEEWYDLYSDTSLKSKIYSGPVKKIKVAATKVVQPPVSPKAPSTPTQVVSQTAKKVQEEALKPFTNGKTEAPAAPSQEGSLYFTDLTDTADRNKIKAAIDAVIDCKLTKGCTADSASTASKAALLKTQKSPNGGYNDNDSGKLANKFVETYFLKAPTPYPYTKKWATEKATNNDILRANFTAQCFETVVTTVQKAGGKPKSYADGLNGTTTFGQDSVGSGIYWYINNPNYGKKDTSGKIDSRMYLGAHSGIIVAVNADGSIGVVEANFGNDWSNPPGDAAPNRKIRKTTLTLASVKSRFNTYRIVRFDQ